jgi:hypothetical protein
MLVPALEARSLGLPVAVSREVPLSEERRRWAILVLLVGSGVAFLSAPLALPPTYSWLQHTISESAAQGLRGAWVARTGFLLYGLAVLWLTSVELRRWGTWGSTALATFGVMMLGTAAYSHRPWLSDVPFDPFEDFLHSATATIMGFAFAIGVILVGRGRAAPTRVDRGWDGVAVLASVVIPMAMMQGTQFTGLLQRAMFAVAYLWYGREAIQRAM